MAENTDALRVLKDFSDMAHSARCRRKSSARLSPERTRLP